MNNNPQVSVIIPVYNTAKYLHESIGSIMNQTLHDIEIIIVNDCKNKFHIHSSFTDNYRNASIMVRLRLSSCRKSGIS